MAGACVVLLAACGGSAPPEPREAAREACTQLAVQQYDLDDAGQVAQPEERPVATGTSFEVTGTSDGVDWTCTWTRSETDAGTTVETTIDRR